MKSQPPFNVGFRVLDFVYRTDGPDQTCTVAVWYPTAAQPRSFTYGGSLTGTVAIDAAPLAEGGPYPMLVFSHGYGGSGLSAVFLTESLAAHGWIVAAPDHHDAYSAARIRLGPLNGFDRIGLLRSAQEITASGSNDRINYEYRLEEMHVVIDRLLASEEFAHVIDSERLAIGGHSLGGFTALGLCGTIKEYFDPRLKAVLLFSTGAGGYLFRESELATVQLPSMLFMGERERNQRRGAQTMVQLEEKIYRNLPAPKYFLEVKGANHFSFNNAFANNWRTRFFSGTPAQFDVIQRYSIAFLERHVAAKSNTSAVLAQGHAMLTRYVREPRL